MLSRMSRDSNPRGGPSGTGNSYFDEGKYEQAITSYSEMIVRSSYFNSERG